VTNSASLDLTVLVDNRVYQPSVRAEHGLSILVQTRGTTVLLDTGQTAQVVQNARLLGARMSEVSHIALSHGHYDHTGGLEAVLGKAPAASVHAHPLAFDRKYKKRDDGTFRFIGCPLQLDVVRHKCGELVFGREAASLPGGLGLTGEVPRTHAWECENAGFFRDEAGQRVPDDLADDQSLYWDGPRGPVVVCGCAHSGVVNTLERVASLTGAKRIHGLVGGLHLGRASNERIERTIDALKRFGVERIGIGHCTGEGAGRRLFDAFGERCFLLSVGERVAFGP